VPPHARQSGGLSKKGPVLTGRAPATVPLPWQAWHLSSASVSLSLIGDPRPESRWLHSIRVEVGSAAKRKGPGARFGSPPQSRAATYPLVTTGGGALPLPTCAQPVMLRSASIACRHLIARVHRMCLALRAISVLETVPRTVRCEVCSMRVAEAAKRQCCVDVEGPACSLAELRPDERRAVVREADQALIERGVPEG
jgi:hypothetical protein